MKAVILAGGFATRLRPLSCSRPKTLFPIVNKPLLQWIFEGLTTNNVTEVVLAVNALTQFHIKQQKPAKCGLKIKYAIDPPKTPLGTAGPIKNTEKIVKYEEPFIVLNGDIFADIDYKQLMDAHVKTGALATIALHKVEDPSRYGVAELDKNNRIKNFIEKPTKEQAPTNFINAGIYILDPKIFDYIPKGKQCSIEREIFPTLAKEHKLFGHLIEGLWMDIGKPEEYLQANKIILDKIYEKNKSKLSKNIEAKKPVAIDKRVIIGKKTVIGPYAILGKNVVIGDNVQIYDSIVFSGAKIGDNTIIKGAIIGEDAVIGKNVQVNIGCIIADQAKIKDNLNLTKELSVCPAKEISETILKRNIIC
ncbi:MAG: NDP-sugar synthase [Candidatus Bathyarchaeota archaeon]|uniref:NDP-sugar synthase n=1 Tax=Candidatus Bathycorpusculum sp. TaxID=2994959 RepID=UPI00281EF2F1|nr:NDP-sugar synthase [Candidatus Termiticorpusculum sp.]MCL2257795.1 NDP-sugar synthase [Candidatus Termiticorpusculum sp.]MCL2291847.1 NDP-sugar synthase [Candidatus Termiticorpusculum sp.]